MFDSDLLLSIFIFFIYISFFGSFFGIVAAVMHFFKNNFIKIFLILGFIFTFSIGFYEVTTPFPDPFDEGYFKASFFTSLVIGSIAILSYYVFLKSKLISCFLFLSTLAIIPLLSMFSVCIFSNNCL